MQTPDFKFLRYFARGLLVGRSRLENSGLRLMRLTEVPRCSAHSLENMRVNVLQQQQIKLDNCVGELTSIPGLHKGTLFNLLHTLKPRHLKAGMS